MLPYKGYFNSLECPFYLTPDKCLRPYCHFKHPKRDLKSDAGEKLSVNPVIDTGVENVVNSSLSIASEVNPTVVHVKHIPIAYIPTKPSAVSVNTKKTKVPYVPTSKSGNVDRNHLMGLDYDPLTVMEPCEKTYSRYSYEKGHDSGDEIMENYKSLIETNQIGKFDDGSKSGIDEETDDFFQETKFSPVVSSPEEVEFEGELIEEVKLSENCTKLSETSSDIRNEKYSDEHAKRIKCKKKRKYSEVHESLDKELGNQKSLDKINDYTDHESISKELNSKSLSTKNEERSLKKLKAEENDDSIKIKSEATTDDKVNKSKNKICKYKSEKKRHSSEDKQKDSRENEISCSSEYKKQPSDKKHSKNNENKSHSDNKHVSSSSKKKESEKKSNSSNSKKASESNEKQSSKIQKNSDNKKPSGETTNDVKKHSSTKHSSKSSSSDKRRSESKKHSSSHSKNEKNKTSSKSKEHSSSNKSSSKKHSKDIKPNSENKKDHQKHSSNSSKQKSEHGKNDKTKPHHSKDKEREKCKKRKRSISSCSITSSTEKKETILISDSSDSDEPKEKNTNNNSPVDIDDIFGSCDSDNHVSDYGNEHHEISESEDEYVPRAISDFSSENSRQKKDALGHQQNFQAIPQNNSDDSYKPSQAASKIRIAHVPNVSSLLTAKNLLSSGKTVPPTIQKLIANVEVAKPKFSTRISPMNASASRPKPQVSTDVNSVIAISIRQPGLNNIFDEFMKFVDYDEAYQRSIDEETEICGIATNPQSYRNRIALCILKIRKSKGAVEVIKKEKITSNSIPDYTYGLTLYECFSKYLLQPQDFVLHGYPLEVPGKSGFAYIDKSSFFRSKHMDLAEGPYRTCLNCGKEYAVDEETGIPLTKDNCHYHWGKLIGMRQGKIYTCCKSEVGSDPCHIGTYHVTELKNEDCLPGFVKTRPYPSDADPNRAGIYAMDCEMCFTTQGRDIVRASLLAVDNESVYDILIKPKYPVLDYCTRFSGITEEKLESVTTTLEDVQKFLLKTINDKTILVGHSLENDLKALKLLHYNVVDTSIMFPHKEGFPVKCALRTLCSRILGSAIQTGEHGHDSLEDARGCLQLVLHQVKEDAKSRKPRIVKELKTSK